MKEAKKAQSDSVKSINKIVLFRDRYSVVFWQPLHREWKLVIGENWTEQLIDGNWKVLCSRLDEIEIYLEKLRFYYINAWKYAKS